MGTDHTALLVLNGVAVAVHTVHRIGSCGCEIKAQGKIAHELPVHTPYHAYAGPAARCCAAIRYRFALIGFAILPVELLFAPTGQLVQSRSISSESLPYCIPCHQVPDCPPTACALAFVLPWRAQFAACTVHLCLTC